MPSRTTSNRSVSAKTDDALPFEAREFRNPDILSCEEIRYWIKELGKNPHWGWSKNQSNLARALGFRKHALECMNAKLKNSWIYPTEQVRLSERIRLILTGHLVPLYDRYPHSYEYANPPRPPAHPPAKMRVSTQLAGPSLHVEQFRAPTAQMPDFKSVFAKARLWKTD